MRAVVERLRVLVFRTGALRDAPPLAALALDARAFVADDFARVVVDLRAVVLRAVALRFPVDFRAVVLRFVVDFAVAAVSSSVHFPDMTR